ncbi:MAG: ABC transporter permease, partial [bacterium]|nr:ABC transporter permease [bacterium]
IGIIGIALILSLSNGVNNYIVDIQKSTMVSYPITVDETTIDLSSMMSGAQNSHVAEHAEHELDGVYSNVIGFEIASAMTTSITENNLTDFKKYIDDENSKINDYIGENGIIYSYNTKFDIFTHDPEGTLVNTDGSTLTGGNGMGVGMNAPEAMMSMTAVSSSMSNFKEFMPSRDGEGISDSVLDNYEVLWGRWCEGYDEIVLIVDRNNEINAARLYQLGILNTSEYREIMEKIMGGEDAELTSVKWNYEEIAGKEFVLIPECDRYIEKEDGSFEYVSDETGIEALMEDALNLKIVGIVRATGEGTMADVSSPVGFTRALTNYIIKHTENSAVVKAQRANPDTNVLLGLKFTPSDDETKIEDVKTYIMSLGISDKASMAKALFGAAMGDTIALADESTLAGMLDGYMRDPADEMLLTVYDKYIATGTYDENMERFGVVSYDAPSSISIYTDTFENKDMVAECIKEYNSTVSEENKITYTDYVGILMSSITTIIDVISYVLIAFVAVSLVVSSIMIGIITYISVLERTKEIGILRALGASKRNVSQVFNAETFIIGLGSGLLGIVITLLLLIPGNMVIHSLTSEVNVSASLPVAGGVILVILSMLLTMIGGLIPSKKAANQDPVTALRTE